MAGKEGCKPIQDIIIDNSTSVKEMVDLWNEFLNGPGESITEEEMDMINVIKTKSRNWLNYGALNVHLMGPLEFSSRLPDDGSLFYNVWNGKSWNLCLVYVYIL